MKKKDRPSLGNVKGPLNLQNSWTTSQKCNYHDFYGVLESVAWLWRVLGIFPIVVKNPIRKYDLSKFYAVYSFIIFLLTMSGFAFNIIKYSQYIRNSPALISWTTIIFRMGSYIICICITNVWRVIRFKELSKSINRLSEQDTILEKMNQRFNYDSSAKIIRTYVWATFLLAVLFVIYDILNAIRTYGLIAVQWFFWTFPLITQVINLTIFVSLVGWIGLKFRSINDKIETVVIRSNTLSPKIIVTADVCAKNLRALTKAHYNICAIGKQINGLFNIDVLINVTTAFIILSTTFYFIFYECQREGETNLKVIFSYIHVELIHGVPIIVTVIVCNWTSNQAIYTGKIIHEIRIEKTDSELYDAVKSFSLQLHHQKLEFTAAGFFPLNSTLLQTMMGTITTYLVILIQFEPKLY